MIDGFEMLSFDWVQLFFARVLHDKFAVYTKRI